jgi:hypothetical protein
MTLVVIFMLGVALLGWHHAQERVRRLRQENTRLRRDLDHAFGAMKPRREFTKLHLLAGASTPRESHSHATKGQAG